MKMFAFCYPTLAVSTIYCIWAAYRRKRERALPEEVTFMLLLLALGLPQLRRLFRDKGVRRDGALLVFFILAWAMVLGPKFVETSKPLISKTGSAEPAQQPVKGIMFPRVS
jgi:hypothetical protein